MATWRASLDVPQPSSPQEWTLVDGSVGDRCFGADRTSRTSGLSTEPAASMQVPCQLPLKGGVVVSLSTSAMPSLNGMFGTIEISHLPSGDLRVRLPNGTMEDVHVDCVTAVAMPTLVWDKWSNVYAVTRAPVYARFLLGVWRAKWGQLHRLLMLPPEGLRNSGFHAKRFETVQEAMAYWVSEGHAGKAPLHFD